MTKWIQKVLCIAMLGMSGFALGQTPVLRLVLPFPAGGSVDVAGRVVGDHLARALGMTLVAVNRSGADGAIATMDVINAHADGTTLLFGTNTAILGVPVLRKSPPYDSMRDLTPISLVGQIGVYLFARNDLPVNSLSELVNLARAQPGRVAAGSAHATGRLALAQLEMLSKTSFNQIPYKGDSALMPDLAGGRLDISIASPIPGLELARSGKVKILATLLEKRNPAFPDVPTMAQAGFPNYSMMAWGAIFAPPNTPKELSERIAATLQDVLAQPEVRAALDRAHFVPRSSSPDELRTFVSQQTDAWRKAVQAAGIEPQ